MKAKLTKGILLILSLLCILCVPVTPVYAAQQGTDGSELQGGKSRTTGDLAWRIMVGRRVPAQDGRRGLPRHRQG